MSGGCPLSLNVLWTRWVSQPPAPDLFYPGFPSRPALRGGGGDALCLESPGLVSVPPEPS